MNARCPKVVGAAAALVSLVVTPTSASPTQQAGAEAPEAAANPLDPPYERLAFEGGAVELPVTLARTQILVDDVWVNGHGPFRFMLDTGGMGAGRVDSSLVEKLGLEPIGEAQGSDGTDRPTRAMNVYELDSLLLGPLSAEGVRVLSRDYNEHGAGVRGHIDGILGIDLFDEVLLTIDYPHSVIRLEQGELPEADGREILPLVPGGAVPTVRVALAGEKHDAFIDTGAMGPLNVPAKMAETLPLTGEPRVVGQARTVTGAFEIRASELDGALGIGRHSSFRPRVVFAEPMRHVVLGGEVLIEYAMTFDQRNDRVRFWRAGWPAPDHAPARTSMWVPSTSIPLTRVNGRPVIEASIDGRGPFRFVLDTGSPMILLNRDLVRELGLETEGESSVGAPGGDQRIPIEHHALSEVLIGDAIFETVRANSWDEPMMQRALGDVRGLIGLPLFHDLMVTLDGTARELRLSHAALAEGDGSVAYDLGDSGLPEIDVEVAGETVTAHLDTGSPGTMTVPGRLATLVPLASEPRVMGRGRTAGGEFEIRGAELDGEVHVAGARLENPTLMFNDVFEHANLGSALLVWSHALSVDQLNRRVLLGPSSADEATAAQPASAKRKSYGIMLGLTPDGPIDVRGVVPGSISEETGLQAGDRIVAINGVDLSELDMDQRTSAFRASRVRLTIERDGERLDFTMSHED